MGDMETTVDDVNTDVYTELDTTDTQDVSDDGVALLRKYKIDPENFTQEDLIATLDRLNRAESVKREEKSKKKEVSVPSDKASDLELRLFFIENEEAKKYKDQFLEVKAKYPDLSFDDALDLAKSKTPKESKTVKSDSSEDDTSQNQNQLNNWVRKKLLT